ncbi:MAG: hypothetical protein AAFW70_31280 [Cyanobacteria bacterium J06635_10]
MRNSKGHFEKGHQEGFRSDRAIPLKSKLTIRLEEQDLIALKSIPNWREVVRENIKLIIKSHGTEGHPGELTHD